MIAFFVGLGKHNAPANGQGQGTGIWILCNRTLTGFHACKAEGDPVFPFLSNDHDKTWLTQGYYFWTDSDTWAKFWGQKSVKSRHFVILKCSIDLAEDEYLDLVGNMRHLELFAKLIQLVQTRSTHGRLTIRSVLLALRKMAKTDPDIFPFLAIKAADRPKTEFKFVEGMDNRLVTLNRQQLCVFEQAKDRITYVSKTAEQDVLP